MAKQTKGAERSETRVNLGTLRKEKIQRYRAQKLLSGEKISSIEEVVLIAVDKFIEQELVPA